MKKKREIFLVLHNVRSAHNVGSIFRTADAAGVSKVFLCGYTPAPSKSVIPPTLDPRLFAREFSSGCMADLPDKIAKTALGAEKTIPWEQHKQTWRLLKKLSTRKVEPCGVVALEQAPNAVDYRKFKPKFPLALVLGNEVGGLSKEILKYADEIIEIPMCGKKESLNVSVAAGIALFKLLE